VAAIVAKAGLVCAAALQQLLPRGSLVRVRDKIERRVVG